MRSNQPSAGNNAAKQGSSTSTSDVITKAGALVDEGNGYYEAAKYKEAIEKYSQTLELFQTPAIFCNRALSYGFTKQYNNAINDCHSALKLDPKCVFAHSVLGKIFCLQKCYNDAIDAYKKALHLDPEQEHSRKYLGYVEKYLKAKEISTPTAEDIKKANALKEQGNECMKSSKFNEAIEKYTEAIALNRNPVYLCNRAAAFCHLKKYDEAENDCADAIFLDDKYAKAHGRMGFSCSCLGNYFAAVEYYQNALELDPTNESYKENFALAKAKIREVNHRS